MISFTTIGLKVNKPQSTDILKSTVLIVAEAVSILATGAILALTITGVLPHSAFLATLPGAVCLLSILADFIYSKEIKPEIKQILEKEIEPPKEYDFGGFYKVSNELIQYILEQTSPKTLAHVKMTNKSFYNFVKTTTSLVLIETKGRIEAIAKKMKGKNLEGLIWLEIYKLEKDEKYLNAAINCVEQMKDGFYRSKTYLEIYKIVGDEKYLSDTKRIAHSSAFKECRFRIDLDIYEFDPTEENFRAILDIANNNVFDIERARTMLMKAANKARSKNPEHLLINHLANSFYLSYACLEYYRAKRKEEYLEEAWNYACGIEEKSYWKLWIFTMYHIEKNIIRAKEMIPLLHPLHQARAWLAVFEREHEEGCLEAAKKALRSCKKSKLKDETWLKICKELWSKLSGEIREKIDQLATPHTRQDELAIIQAHCKKIEADIHQIRDLNERAIFWLNVFNDYPHPEILNIIVKNTNHTKDLYKQAKILSALACSIKEKICQQD